MDRFQSHMPMVFYVYFVFLEILSLAKFQRRYLLATLYPIFIWKRIYYNAQKLKYPLLFSSNGKKKLFFIFIHDTLFFSDLSDNEIECGTGCLSNFTTCYEKSCPTVPIPTFTPAPTLSSPIISPTTSPSKSPSLVLPTTIVVDGVLFLNQTTTFLP